MEKVKKGRRRKFFRKRNKPVNRNCGDGLNWKHMEPQEGWSVVKGTTHRVIVVKSPDKRYFEEAIFVVRDEILREKGADNEAILKEAHKIANSYMGRYQKLKSEKPKRKLFSKMPAPFIAAAGAAATGVAWLTAKLVGL